MSVIRIGRLGNRRELRLPLGVLGIGVRLKDGREGPLRHVQGDIYLLAGKLLGRGRLMVVPANARAGLPDTQLKGLACAVQTNLVGFCLRTPVRLRLKTLRQRATHCRILAFRRVSSATFWQTCCSGSPDCCSERSPSHGCDAGPRHGRTNVAGHRTVTPSGRERSAQRSSRSAPDTERQRIVSTPTVLVWRTAPGRRSPVAVSISDSRRPAATR
jgi:hypothetical protein